MGSELLEDFTQLEKAQQALLESEDKFHLISRLSPAGIYLTAPNGDCLYVNEAWCRMAGLTPREALGQGWINGLHPDDRQLVFNSWRAMVAAGGGWKQEYRFQDKKGTTTWVYGLAAAHTNAAGKIVGYVGINFDITARKQAEEALRQIREDQDRAQAVGQIGSWRLNVRDDVLSWSDETYRIFGLPKGAPLTYETFLKAVHPEDREYVDAEWQAGLAGEPYDIEHRVVADGQVKWVREKAYLEFDREHNLLGGFGIVQDITERKRAEIERLENEERLRRLTTQLTLVEDRERQRLATALHDTVIQTMAAAKIHFGVLRESITEQQKTVYESGMRLLQEGLQQSRAVLHDLSPPLLAPLGLETALQALANEMEALGKFSCTVTISGRQAALSEEAVRFFYSAVRELLWNAVKYSESRHTRVALNIDATEAILTVADDGVGFDDACTVKDGAGFGLFSLKEQTRALSGRCEVKSVQGGGTGVTIAIPLSQGLTRRNATRR